MLSPQYVVWLIPLVPLVARPVWAKAMLAVAASMVLTNVYFPWHYGGITHVTSWVWVLLLRNVALTASPYSCFSNLRRQARALPPLPESEAVDQVAAIPA